MASKYLMHITIDTGNVRQSYREEVNDAVLEIVRKDVIAALAGLPVEIQPGYHLHPVAAGAVLIATIMTAAGNPLITIAVVGKSRESAKTWAMLQAHMQASGDPPQTPWCAVKLHPDANTDHDAMMWLGDYERCLAWAWLDR